jgi:hypothetical protein
VSLFIDGVLKEFPWIKKYSMCFVAYGAVHYGIVVVHCMLALIYPDQITLQLFPEVLLFVFLLAAGTLLIQIGLRARQQ